MEYKKLGESDIYVSPLCLGTMTWGTQNNYAESNDLMNFAYENGINFIDTAEQYPAPSTKEKYGISEKIIGEWINEKKIRNKMIIATKMSGPGVPWIRNGDLQYSKNKIKDAVEGSLRRLKTEYIDLYQLHWPERLSNQLGINSQINLKGNFNNFEDILNTFEILIKEGKIRCLGLANENFEGLTEYFKIIKRNNFSKIVSMQNRFNLIYRNYDNNFFNLCKDNNISILGYSPLAFGMLTGKYINNYPDKSRLKLFPNYFNRYSGKESKNAVLKYSKLSKSMELPLIKLSLPFCLNQSFLTSAIIGSTNVFQLKEIIEATNIKLNKEIIDKIDKIHAENKDPTIEKEFNILIYLKNGLKLILKGDFINFIKKFIKFLKKIIS